jgi:Zn finger protein HypA/HybF involved in hydrogenase expression
VTLLDLNNIAKKKAQEILQTKGIEITCPSCKEKFIGRSMEVECPHCHKTFDVEFNVK